MRNMAFSMTTEQIRNRTKTVTRRFGWAFLKPGDILQPVEKGMGIKKGEHPVKVGGPIRIITIRRCPLNSIDKADCIREGFPEHTAREFVDLLVTKYRCPPDAPINRIEFEYVEEAKP